MALCGRRDGRRRGGADAARHRQPDQPRGAADPALFPLDLLLPYGRKGAGRVSLLADLPGIDYLGVFPAKAGTHRAASAMAEKWVPAFAGMTVGLVGNGKCTICAGSGRTRRN